MKSVLAYARHMRSVLKKLHKKAPGHHYPPDRTDHVLERVRTNGWQARVTIGDALQELIDHHDEVDSEITRLTSHRDRVGMALRELAGRFAREFRTCPSCGGVYERRGRKDPPEPFANVRQAWIDCETCDGFGVVEAST